MHFAFVVLSDGSKQALTDGRLNTTQFRRTAQRLSTVLSFHYVELSRLTLPTLSRGSCSNLVKGVHVPTPSRGFIPTPSRGFMFQPRQGVSCSNLVKGFHVPTSFKGVHVPTSFKGVHVPTSSRGFMFQPRQGLHVYRHATARKHIRPHS